MLPDKKFGPMSANPMSHGLGFFDPGPSVSSSRDLKADPHWASHACSGLRGGVILVLLVELSDRLLLKKSQIWIVDGLLH